MLIILGRLFISIILLALQVLFFVGICNYIASPSSSSVVNQLVLVAIYIVEAIAVIRIINRDWKPEFKLAWIIPICSIPVFGILFYLFMRYDASAVIMRIKLKKSLSVVLLS